jgi:hypothetical protein
VFVIVDAGLDYQQRFAVLQVAQARLAASSNRLDALLLLVPELLRQLTQAKPPPVLYLCVEIPQRTGGRPVRSRKREARPAVLRDQSTSHGIGIVRAVLVGGKLFDESRPHVEELLGLPFLQPGDSRTPYMRSSSPAGRRSQ